MSTKIMIFDTTLRDGEQSPGASLNIKEKLEIARQLARLKVDVIEAGFPSASPGDFEAVQLICQEVKGPIVAALARTKEPDIDRAGESLQKGKRTRLHTFIATSPIHMKYKLKMSPGQVIKTAVKTIRQARGWVEEVEFSPEDATRSEPKFLCEIIEAAIKAGATIINIPDTVGYTTPEEFETLISHIRQNTPNISKAIISVHCHNDLGMATANSLAAVKAGARQIECTINGIGERAGNASLEEVVMTLRTRKDIFALSTDIKTDEIYRTSRLVSKLTGMPVQPNKAVVGANAFSHEAGVHQDGMLKEKRTYEIMTPESIGLKESRLVLGKHSGRHAFREKLRKLGYQLKPEEIDKAFDLFKQLTDKKKEVFDDDLKVIIEDEVLAVPETFHLDYIHVVSGNQTIPTATVRISKEGQVIEEAACGDGPVDASYRAIDRVTHLPIKLLNYSIKAVTSGKDALGEVVVKVESRHRVFTGRGSSTDILEASAKAYLNAINKIVRRIV